MKKYIFLSIAALFLVTCNTYENMVQERGANAAPIMSDPVPAYFSDNIEASFVQFDLSMPPGQTADKVSIEISGKGQTAILKDVSLPVTGLKVTAQEVLTALNMSASNYNRGDVFFLYVLTTKNGVTTRSKAAFPIPVVCFFEPSMLVGDFYYVSASWDEEGLVTFVADPNDPHKVYIHGMAETQGFVGNGNGIELTVNPNNFNVVGARSIIIPNAWSYTNMAYQAMSGTYSACDEMFTITFAITVDQGGFGNFGFVFKRQ